MEANQDGSLLALIAGRLRRGWPQRYAQGSVLSGRLDMTGKPTDVTLSIKNTQKANKESTVTTDARGLVRRPACRWNLQR